MKALLGFAAFAFAVAFTGAGTDAVAGTKPSAGCTWVGKRIVQALLRDDVVAAGDYTNLYKTFACPTAHLARAFSCTVGRATAADAAGNRAAIDACWANPQKPVAKAPAAAKR